MSKCWISIGTEPTTEPQRQPPLCTASITIQIVCCFPLYNFAHGNIMFYLFSLLLLNFILLF